jgi:putative sterol carrier protein
VRDPPARSAETTSAATSEFFDDLERRTPEPILQQATGSVRFDLLLDDQIDHWLVGIDTGEIAVSRDNVPADCVVRADQALFDGIACGEVNAMAALLRGELTADGDLELLALVQRLFPRPTGSRSGASAGRADA